MTISYPYEPEDETPVCDWHDGGLYCVLKSSHDGDHRVALSTGDAS